MRLTFRFLLPLIIVLGGFAYAVVPLVDTLMIKWAINDLDLRSKLIASTIDDSLFEVIDNDRTKTKTKVQSFFDRILQDKRLFALGFCGTDKKLQYMSMRFPSSIDCPNLNIEPDPQPSTLLKLPTGSVHVSYFPMQGSGQLLGELVLLHDMSFAETRSAQTRNYIMLFIAAIGALVAIITIVIAQLSWRGWVSGIRGLLHGEGLIRPIRPSSVPSELKPIAQDLRNLLRDLESDRRVRDDTQVTWNPRALKELLQQELAGDEIIVVSNREPYIHTKVNNSVHVQTPASGLVTALEPIMRACSGTWIAHGAGNADRETVDRHDRVGVPPEHPRYQLRRIWLSAEEENGYYNGFANEGLWPLCHLTHVRPIFRSADWEQYKAVNKKFAQAVLEEAKTKNPVILVQDYHFALLPKLIKEHLPHASIITFWHIPWPNAESFGICPWASEILEGLLGSSIMGFQTRFHSNNFIDCAERQLECRIDREHWSISFGGHETFVQRYPISIEYPGRHMRTVKSAPDAYKEICAQYGFSQNCLLGIGVDRFDYTKGISEKFASIERLFELHPEWIGRFQFVQIAAPTRTKIEEYRRFQEEATQLANRINKRFSRKNYQPIVLVAEHRDTAEILDHYRAAHLCFVGSLHDGMNLVAKEFIASRDDEQGVLILSKFTGSARDLPEALIVNPYHTDECAEALHTALAMPLNEQRDRIRNMRAVLQEFNVYRWAGRMLLDAARMRQRNRFLGRIRATDLPTHRKIV